MSSPHPPNLAGALSSYWPLLVALAALSWAHLDLRMDVYQLEARLDAEAASNAVPLLPARGHELDASVGPHVDANTNAPDANVSLGLPSPEAAADTVGPLSPWDCSGSIARAAVMEVIGTGGAAVLECHERLGNPAAPMRLEVMVKVLENGSVDAVHIPGQPRNPMTECVARAAQQWTFPGLTDGECATVAVPFALGADPAGATPPAPE